MFPNAKTCALIADLTSRIQNHTLDTRCLSDAMTESFDGTDANGAWDWRLAFDLM